MGWGFRIAISAGLIALTASSPVAGANELAEALQSVAAAAMGERQGEGHPEF